MSFKIIQSLTTKGSQAKKSGCLIPQYGRFSEPENTEMERLGGGGGDSVGGHTTLTAWYVFQAWKLFRNLAMHTSLGVHELIIIALSRKLSI
jgi:hypothetical protein